MAPAALGLPHLHLRETGSTNARARELAERGAPHGTLVSADVQTAGRGRQGRAWASPAGVLAQSLVLRLDPRALAAVPLAAAVAVARVCGPHASIKWPNDIWLGAGRPDSVPRKVAGILVETRAGAGWAVLGIGINAAVDLDDLGAGASAHAATLGLEAGALPQMRTKLVAALGEALELPRGELHQAWEDRDALRGRVISWGGGSGVAAGIDDDGALVVRLGDGGTTTLDAGEVHLDPLN